MNSRWFLRSVCTNGDFNLEKAIINVGRHSSQDLICLSNVISRKHAVLMVEDDKLYVEAFKNINGTWVNGLRLSDGGKTQVFVNDQLCFGHSQHPDCDGSADPPHYCYQILLHNMEGADDLLRILEGRDASQEIVVKEEVEYSNNEEVIIIDDDNNFEIASSQIFNENSIVKTEPVECIEISDSDDEDSDIFKLLWDEPLSPIDNGLDDDNRNGEISPKDDGHLKQDENQNLLLNDQEVNGGITDKKGNDINAATSLDSHVPIPSREINHEHSDEITELKSKGVVDRSFILRSAYSKPSIVPPHNEDTSIKKRRKSISKEEKNDAKKQKIEHKPLSVENFNNEFKIPKRPRGRPKKQTENIDVNTSSKGRRTVMNKKDTASKIKNGVLQSIQSKQDNLVGPENNITNFSKNGRYTTRNSLLKENGFNKGHVQEPNDVNDITSNITDDLKNCKTPKKLSFCNIDNPVPSTSKGDQAITRDPRRRNGAYNNVNIVTNGEIVNDDDLVAILKCHVNHNVRAEAVDLKNQYPFLAKPSCTMIYSVVGWNTKWLHEQQEQSIPPPIIRNDVVKMCTRFMSGKDYSTVVKPFITLELWDNLIQGFKLSASGKKRFRTSIREVRKFTHYQILTCIAYSNDKDQKLLNRPKEGDVIIINIGVRPTPNARQAALKCLFAFVVSCTSKRLKPTDYIYKDLLSDNNDSSCQLNMHLLLKPFPEEVLVAKFVDATIITSITSILRECDALTQMNKSPLSKLILNPKLSNFTIQRNNNLVINKKSLSKKQITAIYDSCSLCIGNRPGLYLIQGPPGTGKTTVIQHIIENLMQYNSNIRVLVVAPSNATVDGIVRKLGKEKRRTDLVRIGIYNSVSNDLKQFFLDEIAKQRIISKILQDRPEVRMDYDNLTQRRHYLCTQLEIEKRDGNKSRIDLLLKELKSIDHDISNFAGTYYADNHYKNMLHMTKNYVMMNAKIYCTTLNSCIRLQEYNINVDCCIVDESSQSKETETLIPLSLGIRKMILVGDPQQLPAVTLSKFAKDLGYGQSLFQRIQKALAIESANPITMLDTQFRMHPEICMYPNKAFYNGALQTAPVCNSRGGLDGLMPYYVMNLNIRTEQTSGYNNQNEIKFVLTLLEATQAIIGCKKDKFYTVGVITPYNSQKKDLIVQIEKLRLPSMRITVNTVDSFQGSEKDIIILSCVRIRANTFLNDEQRLNVALTRARRVLYVVGTNPLFDTSPTLKSLKSDARSRGLYLNVHDFSITALKSLVARRT